MGQKVHPVGIRLGIVKDWSSTWYADRREYASYLTTDIAVRNYIREKLSHASVSNIQIRRPAKNARIIVHTARPGIVIGKKGEDIEALRREVSGMMGVPVHIAVEEIRNGKSVRESLLLSCKARTRPIMITALALIGGASVILYDPIFQGMAISLMFGVFVSTVLTLLVIPLGCASANKSMRAIAQARDAAGAPKAS